MSVHSYELEAALFRDLVVVVLFGIALADIRLFIVDIANIFTVTCLHEVLTGAPDGQFHVSLHEVLYVRLDSHVAFQPAQVFGELKVRGAAHAHVDDKVPAAIATLITMACSSFY
jgi:hypothetical protein